MRLVRTGPLVGLLGQVTLLAVLWASVGLGLAGWVAGAAYGLVVFAALTWSMNQLVMPAFGPANGVTLARATLVGGVTALVADSYFRTAPVSVLVTITIVALALDGVDGLVARGTGTASALGARFDMEVDAFLILVLSLYVTEQVGLWVLAIGLMRYAYVAASWLLPWLRGPLPPRFWRKVVAATQGVVLVVAASGVFPTAWVVAALAIALALLVESFGRDIIWRWHH